MFCRPRVTPRPVFRRILARRVLAAGMVAGAWVWGACTSEKPRVVDCETITYQSMGQPVPVHLCLPQGEGAVFPALVYLHAVDGTQELPSGLFAELVGHGIAVYAIQYFALTPAPGPNPGSYLQAYLQGRDEVAAAAAPVWVRVITDGIAHLRTLPGIDGQRIGVMGYSLGAAMTLTVAASSAELRAAVLLSGFLGLDGFPRVRRFISESFATNVASFPPALIIHGNKDSTAPLAQARTIHETLHAAGRTSDFQVMVGADHYWKGKQGSEARRRIVAFLSQHLGT